MLRCLKLLAVTSVLVLTGCGYFSSDNSFIQNRDTDYLKATTTRPLQIPPGLSSSTIEAHYPVSDREFPNSSKKVTLTPPNLSGPPVYVSPQAKTQTPAPVAEPVVAAQGAPIAPVQQKPFAPNTYYDPYTRATTTKAGIPIGDALKSIWPWGKKNTIQTSAQQKPASDSKPSPLSWLWTVSDPNKPKATAPAPSAAPTTENTQEAQNNTGTTPPDKSTIPGANMYYDRYTKR